MYSMDQILSGIKRPELMISEINRLYTHTKNGCRYNPNGINIFDEEWDNLLILDACRYDMFLEQNNLPGKLESRESCGSTSPEFIRGNFSNKKLYDVVYVSANGWFAKLKEEIDSEVYDFEFVERDTANGLTSRPETVANRVREYAERYPQKRLIGHFMQPHQPFIGSSSKKFNQGRGLEKTVQQSNVTKNEVIKAYRENLDLVLEEVEKLITDLEGRTVVTADHGEIFNEQAEPIPVRRYGHPEANYCEHLVNVPWHIINSDTRRKTVEGKPLNKNDMDFSKVERHLSDLGYRT